MNTKIMHRIEEILLSALILIQILDFLEILPGDLDFLKKFISWTAIGYLFYKASISNILFGSKIKFLDFYYFVICYESSGKY